MKYARCLFCLLMLAWPMAGADDPPPPTKPVEYFIIVTGGEMLAGAFPDSHTHFLAKTLRPLGLHCVGSLIVDDLDDDLRAGLKFATNKAPLVIVTGGLGPTDNDITRQTIARFSDIPLQEQPELLADMARRVNTPVEQLRPNLRRQTQVPTRGTYLKNSNGSAAGLIYDLGHVHIVALPGPPRELQPMVKDELIPLLTKHFGTRPSAASITLRFLGLGQSQIDYTIKQHTVLPSGLITSSQFEGGRVDFTFSLPDDSAAAKQKLQALKKVVYEWLGTNIYAEGETTLEEVVIRKLQNKKATIALAEIGSGGALAAALAKAASSRQVLAMDWVAPTEPALFQALQTPETQWAGVAAGFSRLKEIALIISKSAKTDYAVVIGASQPDPSGANSLLVILKGPDNRWESQSFATRGTGDAAQAHLVTQLLGFLWRKLP